ncbi:ALS_1a_G0000060.mRNA.1.CDS.1 [Saccharomyces cerevisiae]|nr:ALS_1a_G0000060.mRNA.1.CDS.1 [Saccharomyces cerevisiae]CAI6465874.1 ALS_1a_G0000060.mRNA.1.CDS.1 [Saccharomyces cerevisiae]
MYKITTIYLWLKSYLSFFIGLDNLDFLTLIRFFSMSFTKQASMVRTCNMVEAAQKTKPHHLWQHLRETPSSCQTLHRNRVGPTSVNQ